jgi:hypothetical protein
VREEEREKEWRERRTNKQSKFSEKKERIFRKIYNIFKKE